MTHMSTRTQVAVAVAAAVTLTPAHAVMQSPDGFGQVLLYPYYTVQGDNDTLISVMNGTDRGKAARVRFLEAMNGRPVFSLNLYLGPHDVWTAKVGSSDNGGTKLVVADASCTVPAIATQLGGSGEQAFSTAGFDGTDGTPADAEASQGVARTREGFVEVVEMGDIDPEYVLINSTNFLAAISSPNGQARNCAAVAGEWASFSPFPNGGHGIRQNVADTGGLSTTTGGLAGTGTVINVARGTDFSYDPVALVGFYMTRPPIHTPPGNTRPSLADAAPVSTVTFIDTTTGMSSQKSDDWTNSAAPGNGGIDAVSAVLMRFEVLNEFVVNPAIHAGTDWIVTLPTKRWYVDQVVNPVRPFSAVFTAGGACEQFGYAIYDQESRNPRSFCGDFFVSSPLPNLFCWSSNVLTFTHSNVLGSLTGLLAGLSNNLNVGTCSFDGGPYPAGYLSLSFPIQLNNTSNWASAQTAGIANNLTRRLINDASPQHSHLGLPVIGFAVQQYVNDMLPGGVLSNYGGSYVHRYQRVVIP